MPLGKSSFYKLVPSCLPSDNFRFGIAIQVSDRAERQLHIGILFRGSDDALQIGDVANHYWSRILPARADGRYVWLEADLDYTTALILAARTEALLRDNEGKIPYSVASHGRVWKDGIWVGDEPGQGLTCATFVLSVFTETGLDLLTPEGWVGRPDDQAWAEKVARAMAEQPGATEEHLKAQLARIGESIRVRPMDVAVACKLSKYSNDEKPLSFTDVAGPSNYWESVLLDPV